MKNATYKFSCLMWVLPEYCGELVIAWGKRHIPDSAIYRDPDDSSVGRENDIHLTVKYGIHTDDSYEISQILDGVKPFPIRLGKISKFNNKNYDVIKMEVSSEELMDVNAKITRDIECTDTYPVYNPHITLAYVKKDSCDDLLDKMIFKDCTLIARKFVFSYPNDNDETDRIVIPLKK